MRVRIGLAMAIAVLVAPGAAPAKTSSHRQVRLEAFRSCDALLGYARYHALRTIGPRRFPVMEQSRQGGPPTAGSPQPTLASPGDAETAPEFSDTNVQEQGVDEPDMVKTDGKRIYALANNALQAIDVTGDEPKLVGSLALPDNSWGQELLLRGDRVLVLGNGSSAVARPAQSGGGVASPTIAPWYSSAVITEVDVHDPAAMKVVKTMTAEGRYVSARRNGDIARVVIASPVEPIVVPAPAEGESQTEEARIARSRAAIKRAGKSTFVPSATLHNARTGSTTTRSLAPCRSIRRPPAFAGEGMLTILTIDLDKGLPAVDSDALMTDADIVYGSPGSLYVTSTRWYDETAGADGVPAHPRTQIHRFDATSRERTTYRASGDVPGYLLNQFSLSEYGGVLRVASTELPPSFDEPGTESSSVTVLDEQAGRLLAIGRVGGMGRGERIRAVRFIGDAGYVVTFRQTDPLYTLDLSTPSDPKVLGELKLLGYSAYLHPVANDLLLGVGQDADETGRTKGTQLALFDVSDLRHPARVAHRSIGQWSSSTAEWDHHAFLYWPATKLAVIPVSAYGNQSSFDGAIGFSIDRTKGIDEVGRVVEKDGGSAQRSLVIGSRLYTLFFGGVAESTLSTLDRTAWVAFPAPPQPEPQPEPKPATPPGR